MFVPSYLRLKNLAKSSTARLFGDSQCGHYVEQCDQFTGSLNEESKSMVPRLQNGKSSINENS